MDFPDCTTLLLAREDSRLTVTLNRPERRNAVNSVMSAELHAVFDALHADTGLEIRMVILRGAGGYFCAGADIKERRDDAEDTKSGEDPVLARNRRGGELFHKINTAPQTVVAVVEGAAMGGGLGMACVADVTIVEKSCRLGLPETGLGIAPAQITPYVVKRIGLTQARHLALTGARFDGAKAFEYGIAHYLCDGTAEIEATLLEVLKNIDRCGPKANAATKRIMLTVGSMADTEMIEYSAETLAELMHQGEGKEGHEAFIEKRLPDWMTMGD